MPEIVTDISKTGQTGNEICELIGCAQMQNLLHVVAYMNKKRKFAADSDIDNQLNGLLLQTIYTNVQRCQEFTELSAALSAAGIAHMPVKGWSLRELYPMPELRTFGDIDIFIHPEDCAKADSFFREQGFGVK